MFYKVPIRFAEKKCENVPQLEQHYISHGPLNENLDPRLNEKERKIRPVEELIEFLVDENKQTKKLKFGKNLYEE
ncbi:hypothetical protein PanWU01x14_093630 [Parasponia andersonii]|uniref:Uncharacterized protein n=1 Tax=Parasponia andersonii TaxID=3476 RepID=A0A2P5D645_PARAD|nr:hypothetical protein PanWU01x14_093630 [Parasponia andersonii]